LKIKWYQVENFRRIPVNTNTKEIISEDKDDLLMKHICMLRKSFFYLGDDININ
jgi:hypothetical protein